MTTYQRPLLTQLAKICWRHSSVCLTRLRSRHSHTCLPLIASQQLSKAKQSNQIMKCTDKKNSGKRYILSENDSQQKSHLNSNTLLRVIYQKKKSNIYRSGKDGAFRHRIRLKS